MINTCVCVCVCVCVCETLGGLPTFVPATMQSLVSMYGTFQAVHFEVNAPLQKKNT